MAPRLNKRQQREKEELAALESLNLGANEEGEVLENEDIEVTPAPKPRMGGFASLALTEDAPSEESEKDEASTVSKRAPKKSRKKRKSKSPAGENAAEDPPKGTSHPKAKGKGKGARKGKADEDDIDEILKQMSAKYPDLKAASSRSGKAPSRRRELWELFSVMPTYLDGDEELRRFFGSKVVNSNRPTSSRRVNTPLRSQLTRPPPDWHGIKPAQGLSMRQLTDQERKRKPYAMNDEKWWTVEHSHSYKKVEAEFLAAVAIGDANGIAMVLQLNPWHIDALLQLGEVFKQQEDYSHATDLTSRALYAYERSFATSFNITSGVNRLDFDFIENRPLFLAVHRTILQLQRRGCMRTAFEFSRFLLELDPHVDPHGAFLHLDFLAPRSGMNDWLLKLWDIWEDVDMEEALGPDDEPERLNPKYLPGMSFARALALWNKEIDRGDKSHHESTAALKEAILSFPSILPVLADKAGVNLPGEVRALPSMRIETGWMPEDPARSAIHLLSHLYAHRSHPIWKQPTHSEWLQRTVTSMTSTLREKGTNDSPLLQRSLEFFRTGPTLSICRHVIVCEIRNLIGFFSPMTVPSSMNAFDPLPPPTSLTAYNKAYFGNIIKVSPRDQATRIEQLRQGIRQNLARLGQDDAELMREFEAVLEANRNALQAGIEGAPDGEAMPGAFEPDGHVDQQEPIDDPHPAGEAPTTEAGE
ncbi:hypothetical protein FRB99_005310, partial [Tulasnella sp. 403]